MHPGAVPGSGRARLFSANPCSQASESHTVTQITGIVGYWHRRVYWSLGFSEYWMKTKASKVLGSRLARVCGAQGGASVAKKSGWLPSLTDEFGHDLICSL